jgi:hypothetical protein
MTRKYVLFIFLLSFLITNVIAFLDEGIRTFNYLFQTGDWIALIIYTLLFSFLPLLLLILNKKNTRHRFLISLLGFIPPIYIILIQLI